MTSNGLRKILKKIKGFIDTKLDEISGKLSTFQTTQTNQSAQIDSCSMALVDVVSQEKKNLFRSLHEITPSTFVNSPVTIRSTRDNGFILDGEAGTNDNIFFNISFINTSKRVLEPGEYVICFKEGSVEGVGVCICYDGKRQQASPKGFDKFEFVIPDGSGGNWIRLELAKNNTFNNTEIHPMVCKKSIYNISPKFEYPIMSGVEMLDVGTIIPKSSDLDEYTTPGVYASFNGTVSESLKHCPHTSTGFRMEVSLIRPPSDYPAIIQKIYPNDHGYFYVRTSRSDLGYGNWFKYQGMEIT